MFWQTMYRCVLRKRRRLGAGDGRHVQAKKVLNVCNHISGFYQANRIESVHQLQISCMVCSIVNKEPTT